MKARALVFVFGALALWQPAALLRGQSPLADALDATDLVWTTGGTGGVGWAYEAQDVFGGDNTFDGVNSARSGHVGDNGESWIQTTVVGPGTISFWWQAFSEPDADWLEFYIDSTLQASISGALPQNPSGWEYGSFPVPAGTNVLKWRYVKDYGFTGGTLDCAWVDQVRYVTVAGPPLPEALNTSGVVWSTAGSVHPNGWFGQTNVTRDGQWAAQSGAVWHGQTNWLQATVSGTTNVSFWWKVSSEAGYDFLEFYTNGILARAISGEVDWEYHYFDLPAAANVLTWLYRRDESGTAGSNCGWLDQVAFSTTFQSLPYTLKIPVRLPDGRIQLTVTGEAGGQCRVEVATNLQKQTSWSQLTNLTTLSASTVIIDAAASNFPARFYRAVSP